jgi:hypothetical protein
MLGAILQFSAIPAHAQQMTDKAVTATSESEIPAAPEVAPASEISSPPALATNKPEASSEAQPLADPEAASMGGKTKSPKVPVESDITVQGMVSYGNWQIFAAGIWEHLYTAGFEYERHTWGYFLHSRMDYAADLMPLTILREPAKLNPYGVRRSPKGDNVTVPGLTFSPIGLRMLWRPNKAFKPYFTVMGGAIGFTKKALSPDASYYDFTLHENIGFYLKMSERLDMKFGLFGDFHFSNAYATAYNPGLDNMNSTLGLTYRFKN